MKEKDTSGRVLAASNTASTGSSTEYVQMKTTWKVPRCVRSPTGSRSSTKSWTISARPPHERTCSAMWEFVTMVAMARRARNRWSGRDQRQRECWNAPEWASTMKRHPKKSEANQITRGATTGGFATRTPSGRSRRRIEAVFSA